MKTFTSLMLSLVLACSVANAGTEAVNPGLAAVATTALNLSVSQLDAAALQTLIIVPPSSPGGEFTFRLRQR